MTKKNRKRRNRKLRKTRPYSDFPGLPLRLQSPVNAESYSTSALMIASSQCMAEMFALQVSNMAKQENMALFPHLLFANELVEKIARKRTIDARILAGVDRNTKIDRSLAVEMRGAPVVT